MKPAQRRARAARQRELSRVLADFGRKYGARAPLLLGGLTPTALVALNLPRRTRPE